MPFVMQATGRLAAEPILNASTNGGWTKFRLLDSRFARGEEITEAVTFVAFAPLAEEFCSRAEKGQIVHAWGHQMTERYTGNDQVERVTTTFKLFEFQLGPRPMRSRQADKPADTANNQQRPAGAAARGPQQGANGGAPRGPTPPPAGSADDEIF